MSTNKNKGTINFISSDGTKWNNSSYKNTFSSGSSGGNADYIVRYE